MNKENTIYLRFINLITSERFLQVYEYKEDDLMRILLVEDDEQLNESLTFKLELEGFTVDSCFDERRPVIMGNKIYMT